MSDYNLVQRGVLTLNVGAVSPVDVVLASAVKMSSAVVTATARGQRFEDPINDLDYFGVTARMLDATHVRFEWNGVLFTDVVTGASEQIVVAWQVHDLSNFGNDVKEVLFRLERLLGYLGENVLQDSLLYDDAGNVTQYRLRLFDTKAHTQAATPNFPGPGLETGELSRVTVTQDVAVDQNDRLSLMKVITDLVATPGVN